MKDTNLPYDLEILKDGRYLSQLIEERFNSPVQTCRPVGQGFYAAVFKLVIEKQPHTLIAKCHKYPGYSARESEQLEILARYSAIPVPSVYHVHQHCSSLPFEALLMEHIPGVNASTVEFPSKDQERRFIDAVVDNLLIWHKTCNPRGFGQVKGPFYGTWLECFERQIGAYHRAIHQERHKAIVSEYVLGVIDRSFDCMAEIFAHSSRVSSLVHSDYNLWNIMVDPETYQPTGVIDPIDAGWADREIDLFHLANCRPELGLLERYLQEVEIDASFQARYTFYRFWDDVKHYVRMGWYEEGRFRRYAGALEAAMNAG